MNHRNTEIKSNYRENNRLQIIFKFLYFSIEKQDETADKFLEISVSMCLR